MTTREHIFCLLHRPRASYLSFFLRHTREYQTLLAKNAHTHFAFAIWMFGGGDKAVRTPFAQPSAPFYGRGLSRQVITQPCAPLTKSYGAIWKCYVCIWPSIESPGRIFALQPPIATTWRRSRVIERSVNYCSRGDVALFMAVVVSRTTECAPAVDRRFCVGAAPDLNPELPWPFFSNRGSHYLVNLINQWWSWYRKKLLNFGL